MDNHIREYIEARGGVDELSEDEKKALIEMRSDMGKVVTTRPRVGGNIGMKKTKRAKKELEGDTGGFLGIRRGHKERGDSKQFSDHLSPLKRYLLKQAGKKWDKVYSDIVKGMKNVPAVQRQHILGHVSDFVAKKGTVEAEVYRYNILLVDEKGILRKVEGISSKQAYAKRKAKEDAATAKVRVGHPTNKFIQYHKLKGAWWEVKLGKDDSKYSWGDVVLTSSLVGSKKSKYGEVSGKRKTSAVELYGMRDVIAVKKRQLSGKEAKKLGLP